MKSIVASIVIMITIFLNSILIHFPARKLGNEGRESGFLPLLRSKEKPRNKKEKRQTIMISLI